MSLHRLLPVALFLLTILYGCNPLEMTTALAAGETSVDVHHQRFNRESYKEIFANAHPDFKESTNEIELHQLLMAIQTKLGRVLESNTVSWNVRNHNLSTFISLSVNTTFENGEGVETFVFRMHDHMALLYNYNINSRQLVLY